MSDWLKNMIRYAQESGIALAGEELPSPRNKRVMLVFSTSFNPNFNGRFILYVSLPKWFTRFMMWRMKRKPTSAKIE